MKSECLRWLLSICSMCIFARLLIHVNPLQRLAAMRASVYHWVCGMARPLCSSRARCFVPRPPHCLKTITVLIAVWRCSAEAGAHLCTEMSFAPEEKPFRVWGSTAVCLTWNWMGPAAA